MTIQNAHAGPMPARTDSTSGTPAPRILRLRALVSDLGVLLLAEAAVAVAATIWLVVRTDRGRLDIGDGDAAIALALLGGVIPAWLAWLALSAVDGATPGQRSAGLAVQAAHTRDRLLRLLLDPRGLIGWLWLTALLWLGEAVLVRWLALLAFAVVLGVALTSTVLWLFRPASPAAHDRLARTRLVAR